MKQIPGRDYTIRKDPLGNEVKVPRGYRFKVGSNRKGIAYNPSSATKEDAFGNLYEIPKGHHAVENEDKTLSVVAAGESPKKTKPKPRKQPPKFGKPTQKLSHRETLRLVEVLADRYGRPEA